MPSPVVVLPWGSRSMRSVGCSSSASAAPRLMAVVVFPTPPFWLATAVVRPTSHPTREGGRASPPPSAPEPSTTPDRPREPNGEAQRTKASDTHPRVGDILAGQQGEGPAFPRSRPSPNGVFAWRWQRHLAPRRARRVQETSQGGLLSPRPHALFQQSQRLPRRLRPEPRRLARAGAEPDGWSREGSSRDGGATR